MAKHKINKKGKVVGINIFKFLKCIVVSCMFHRMRNKIFNILWVGQLLV